MPWTFDCSYSGVANVRSLSYVTSVGISPGVVNISCHPASVPAAGGPVTFAVTDGATTRTITLPDCFLEDTDMKWSGSEVSLVLRIVDRRWKWMDRYPVYGHFNQQDDHRKLVPWSVRSPYQLAVMLLTSMGEPVPGGGWESVIDLPAGLASPASVPLGIPAPASFDEVVDGEDDYLRAGTNFTRSRTNPVAVWEATPAAVALARLCEQFGRLVILDPLTNAVSVQRYGAGAALPAGRLLTQSFSVDPESVPAAVTAAGAPTRYQIRMRTQAVGREWDSSWQPLSRLSYAPALPSPGQKMVVEAECVPPIAANYSIFVNGVKFTSAAVIAGGGVVTDMAAQITASTDPKIVGKVTAAAVGQKLVVTAVAFGYEFRIRGEAVANWTIDCTVGPMPAPVPQINQWAVAFTDRSFTLSVNLTITVNGTPYTVGPLGLTDAITALADAINAGVDGNATATGQTVRVDALATGSPITVTATAAQPTIDVTVTEIRPSTATNYGFHRSIPDSFPNVRPNNRLNYEESRSAASGSVFSCYQVVAENPNDEADKNIPLPNGLAAVALRHYLALLGSRVEQIEPSHGDADIVDPRTGQSYAFDTYNGYSADRDPAAYGGVHMACWGGLYYNPPGGIGPNTNDDQRIAVPFSVVDPLRQVVRFERPIYRLLGKGDKAVYIPADPVIEIGVYVLDKASLSPLRYAVTVAVPGATAPPVTRIFEDIQQEIVSLYDRDHKLTNWRVNDADPEQRATTYATETALRYQRPTAQTLTYNNMEGIALSGLVRQVQWAFDAGGFSTTASSNTEFSRVVLPLGERRRLENQSPDAQRAAETMYSNPGLRGLPSKAVDVAKSVIRTI